jgi:uncharacterized membrane protein YhaH (DUF805 family)
MTLSTWFDFSGRLGRAKFWTISLSNLVLLVLVMAPAMAAGTSATFTILALSASGHPDVLGLFSLASVVLSVWGLVWLGLLRGTVGPNRFGPDPQRNG